MEVSKLTLEIFSQLEKKWLMDWESGSNPWSPQEDVFAAKKKNKTRILSIDGAGGMRGLVAGEALIQLEDRIKSITSDPDARIPDAFDLIAGTGMGGVLAVMITVADASGRPLFSAREAVSCLLSQSRRLFRPAGLLRLRRRGHHRFSGSSFESVLKEALKGRDGRALTLRDACKPLLVPCYDLNTSAPFVFSKADASESSSYDFELWRVCRATAATPGLFAPCVLSSVDGSTTCEAVDGGLVMNNPSAATVTHALHNKRDFPSVAAVDDLLLLSLGNGLPSTPSTKMPKCSRGAVMEIVLGGVSETVDQMLANAFCWNPTDYVRIQANGLKSKEEEEEEEGVEAAKRAGERMLKERGVETLPFGGKRLLTETNGERIEGLAQRLVVHLTTSTDATGTGGGPDTPVPSPSKETAAVTRLANGR